MSDSFFIRFSWIKEYTDWLSDSDPLLKTVSFLLTSFLSQIHFTFISFLIYI